MKKITKELKVEIAGNQAFKKFLNELNEWWPKEYTWSQEALQEIRINGKKDGLCTEIGPHGYRCDWGRVTELVENQKIELKWQIGPMREPVPDPAKASDLEIVFEENGTSSTTIKFEHRNFANHGDGAEKYLQMMDGSQGWDYILECYKNYCESRAPAG